MQYIYTAVRPGKVFLRQSVRSNPSCIDLPDHTDKANSLRDHPIFDLLWAGNCVSLFENYRGFCKMAPLIIEKLNELFKSGHKGDDYLRQTAELIQKHFPEYNWVGFYFLKDNKLHVGPYVGKPTPHTVIDLNKGVCGAAVSLEKTIVVDDVNADPRYLACSLETRSEIVIPIRVDGKIIGELDIDSEKKAAFSADDRQLLEEAVALIEKAIASF